MINVLCQLLERELQLEKQLFFFFNCSHSTFEDYLFWFCSNSYLETCLYISCLFFFLYKKIKNKNEILLIVFSIIFMFLLSDEISSGFFKPFFHRLRPSHHPDFKDHVRILFGYKGGLYGFISGHTANAFGFAVISSLIFQNHIYKCMIMFFACMVGYSRIYLGVHFISDVIVGAFIGILIGAFSYQLHCIMFRICFLKSNTYKNYN